MRGFQSWVWNQAGVDYPSSAYSGAPAPWASQNTILEAPDRHARARRRGHLRLRQQRRDHHIGAGPPGHPSQHTTHVNIVEKVYPDGTFDAIGGNQGPVGAVTRNSRIDWRTGTSASHRVLSVLLPPSSRAPTSPSAAAERAPVAVTSSGSRPVT